MKVFTALPLLLAIAACAPTGAGPTTTAAAPRQCFPVQSVNGFSPVDRDTINVNVGLHDIYQLELYGNCQNVDWANVVGLRSQTGGTFICSALDIEVIAPSTSFGVQTCQVRSMRKLSETEVAAMKPRPKAGT